MISGPHRMRKKMYRNDMFYLHYPYDPKVAKLVRQVWKLVWKLKHVHRYLTCVVGVQGLVLGLVGGKAMTFVVSFFPTYPFSSQTVFFCLR